MSDDSTAENRLREVLHDPRWALPTWPDPQDRVQRLARRQRVIAAGLAAGTSAGVAAAIVVPLAVLGGGQATITVHVQANQPPGTVVTQNPPAGSRIAPGSQINLTVAAATSSP
jgi:ABC-type lipoprotein release transport system permease subunit